MLTVDTTVLIVIDIQEKLSRLMYEKEVLFENIQKLIKGVQVLDIPIIWTEQYPRGLGPTIPEVACLMSDIKPITKLAFTEKTQKEA